MDEIPSFTVTIEDCQRWIIRLQQMAESLKKDKPETEDNLRMMYTCAVLMSRLGLNIQQESLLDGLFPLFGKADVGEA